MKTYTNATTADLRNKVNEWKEMTECNEHSDLLCDMAIFFEMGSEYVNYFFDLSMKNGLTLEECNARYEKKKEMLEGIRTQHGEMVYNFILKAF